MRHNGLLLLAASAYLSVLFAPSSRAGEGLKTAPRQSYSASVGRAVNQANPNQNREKFARGVVRGQPFEAAVVCYDSNRLVFKSAPISQEATFAGAIPITNNDGFVGIALVFPKSQNFTGEYFVSPTTSLLTADNLTQPRPDLIRYVLDDSRENAWHNDARYSMSLKFFKKVKGMLPGYIDLRVTEGKEETHVKGYFYAVQRSLAL